MARKALLIGTKTYGDDFKDLNSALHDVQALAALLGNPAVGGFDVEVAEDLTAAVLAQRMETWYLSHGKDDLALLFVAGHGVKDGDRQLHFAATNTQKRGERLITTTAVAASNLSQWMRKSKAKRQVVILNCCFSGAFGDLVPMDDGAIGVEDALGAEGRVVLTSTSSMDYAFERLNGELSVYGHYLVEGLRTGAAAAVGSDDITIAELHEYVSRKVQEEAPAMVPQWFAKGEAAQLRIAKVAIGEPTVQYRQKVEKILRDDGDEIDPVFSRPILEKLAAKLKLEQLVVEAIEDEVLKPIRQQQEKRQEYRKFFTRAVQQHYPFGQREQKRVDEYRRMLSLQDKDYDTIEKAVLGEFRSHREDLGNGIFLDMVLIRGGHFLMGAAEDEEGANEDEYPQHRVTVPNFWMGKFVVSQSQWREIAQSPRINRDLNPAPSHFKGGNRPVEKVSWLEAVEFCDRLAQKTGKPYRLPSEAEWEYACRAGTNTPFYFGETIDTNSANYNGNTIYGQGRKGQNRKSTTPVDQFSPNAFGLCDMHGNVWEWCLDHWHDDYQEVCVDGSAWMTPNASEDPARLLRGGSWDYNARFCRSAQRNRTHPNERRNNIGFRLVCSFEGDLNRYL